METVPKKLKRFYWKPALIGALALPVFILSVGLSAKWSSLPDQRDRTYEEDMEKLIDRYEREKEREEKGQVERKPGPEEEKALEEMYAELIKRRSGSEVRDELRGRRIRGADSYRPLRQERIAKYLNVIPLPPKPTLIRFLLTDVARNFGEFSAVVATLAGLGFALTVIAGWVLTYPHVGWKRIAVVVAVILPAVVVTAWWEDLSREAIPFICASIAIMVGAPFLVLVLNDLISWIIRGFKQPAK